MIQESSPNQMRQDKWSRNTREARGSYRIKWPFKPCFYSLWLEVPGNPESNQKKQGHRTGWEKQKIQVETFKQKSQGYNTNFL